MRASTAAMLADLGYAVLEAVSAGEALALMEGGVGVDLLVSDHLMPGITGADLARRFKERWPGVPVLIITGYADVEAIAPDPPRLVKPFRQADLAGPVSLPGGRRWRDASQARRRRRRARDSMSKGLAQNDRVVAKRLGQGLGIGVAAGDHDRQVGPAPPRLAGGLGAVHARHGEIQQHQVGPGFAQHLQGGLAAVRLQHAIADRLQGVADQGPHLGVVVDHQDGPPRLHWQRSAAGRRRSSGPRPRRWTCAAGW